MQERDIAQPTEQALLRELELMWEAYANQYRLGDELVNRACKLLSNMHTDESAELIAESARDLALAMKDWCDAAETTLEIK